MSDFQTYMSPVRGAVAQHVPGNDDRNPNAWMGRQTVYGPVSLRRWGPRGFGDTQVVGGALQGLGDYLDANDARAQGLDAASYSYSDGNGGTVYTDAGGTVLATTNAAGVTTSVPLAATSSAAGPDWTLILFVGLGALLVAELG